jgi:hypothetical protein
MVYHIVIILALGGGPQTFVGKQEFSSLRECNIALFRVQGAVKGDWAATCRADVAA